MIRVVLDDDPTGTQAMSGVTVILDWDDPGAWELVRPTDPAVHVLTNSRAHSGGQAAAIVRAAATAARERLPSSPVLLRGDSTLRAHLWEEYEALRAVVSPGREDIPLVLIPALPSAGRITIDGVHWLQRHGERQPLHLSEYAHDGGFSYSTSRLAAWAQERSDGRLREADAITLPLSSIRDPSGPLSLADAIESAASCGRAAAVVPDAETESDLAAIAAGVRLAESRSLPFIVRSAPAFVSALTGHRLASADEFLFDCAAGGILVVCGSFVPTTTAQVARLEECYPGTTIAADVAALSATSSEHEIERISGLATTTLAADGLAVVVTDRDRNLDLVSVDAQRRVARALAQVAGRVPADVIVAKGGITSAVTARTGLGARAARVIGPILPGVSLWQLDSGQDYVVVPGNVGDPDLLVELVDKIKKNTKNVVG